jgi:hypothetical protein
MRSRRSHRRSQNPLDYFLANSQRWRSFYLNASPFEFQQRGLSHRRNLLVSRQQSLRRSPAFQDDLNPSTLVQMTGMALSITGSSTGTIHGRAANSGHSLRKYPLNACHNISISQPIENEKTRKIRPVGTRGLSTTRWPRISAVRRSKPSRNPDWNNYGVMHVVLIDELYLILVNFARIRHLQ